MSLRIGDVEKTAAESETSGCLEGGEIGRAVISSRVSAPSNSGHAMRSTVNPSDDAVTSVGDVDEISVGSNAARISKQGLLTGGIYPPFAPVPMTCCTCPEKSRITTR
jgi:hypothetical protein